MKIKVNKKNKFFLNLFIFLINLISKSWRFNIIGEIPEGNSVFVFWHGFMLPCWKLFEGKSVYALVSKSKDGEILSRLLAKWNFRLIRGSSSDNGKVILQQIIDASKGGSLLITPDGPRGPKYQMKSGAVICAAVNQIPLYAIKATISSKKIFQKSWDNFQFPMPFTKINIEISCGIMYPGNLTRNEFTNKIKETNDFINHFYFDK